MDNMSIAFILSLIAFFVLLLVVVNAERSNKKLRKQLEEAVQAGLDVQNAGLANDKALRQGLEDQKEIYEAEIMELDDKIKERDEQLIASRGNLNRLLNKIHDLQTAHAMHTDHCLPVLEEMRGIQLIPDTPPAPTANDIEWLKVGGTR